MKYIVFLSMLTVGLPAFGKKANPIHVKVKKCPGDSCVGSYHGLYGSLSDCINRCQDKAHKKYDKVLRRCDDPPFASAPGVLVPPGDSAPPVFVDSEKPRLKNRKKIASQSPSLERMFGDDDDRGSAGQ